MPTKTPDMTASFKTPYNTEQHSWKKMIPVAVWYKIFGLLVADIAGLNLAEDMDVHLLYLLCVVQSADSATY
jgi:hypothetical protein